MTDYVAAMIVTDVPADHAAPGVSRSKKRPAKTNRNTAGRASGLADASANPLKRGEAQRAWELMLLLQVLDESLPLNTAAKEAVRLLVGRPGTWPEMAAAAERTHDDFREWRREFAILHARQRQIADQARGKHKGDYDALLSAKRAMVADNDVRRGFELERDRLIMDGLPSRMIVIPDRP